LLFTYFGISEVANYILAARKIINASHEIIDNETKARTALD
jgi:hypothetical protein